MRTNIRCLVIEKDSIVLCKNISGKFYFLPGGGLEEGETINECILREFNEEMGIASDKILIEKDAKIVEHIFESEGTKYHEMNILKRVYVDVPEIKSAEDHIAFEKVKIKDLSSYKLLPEKIKNLIISEFNI